MTAEEPSAVEWTRRVRTGEWSARQVTEHFLQRIATLNPRLNAFVEVWTASAMEQAQRVDQKRAAGQQLGPLAGVPIGIKDNLCVAGQVCSAASRMLANFRPTYTATVCQRLERADAVLMGRTNMDEFAMGSGTEYSCYGPTRNPHLAETGPIVAGPGAAGAAVNVSATEAGAGATEGYSPGGSSGGSAAAVAAGMVPLTLGSDTGGSIRQPAAFCGVYGLKPTYGRVSRYGLLAFASSLDQVGPLANSPEDLESLFLTIEGADDYDATCLSSAAIRRAEEALGDWRQRPLRVGFVAEHTELSLDPAVRQAWEATRDYLQSQGAMVTRVSLPYQTQAIAAYYLVASCEAASNLSRYDGMHFGHRANLPESTSLEQVMAASRGEGFGAEVKRRILLGTFALSQGYADRYYQQALRLRQAIRQDFATAFQSVDVLLGPTTAAPAFAIGAHRQDPVAMYLTDQFTVSANLAGLPAISIPVAASGNLSRGLPVAVQFHAPPCGEGLLFHVADLLHRWNLRHLSASRAERHGASIKDSAGGRS